MKFEKLRNVFGHKNDDQIQTENLNEPTSNKPPIPNPSMTRRQFLKTATRAGAAIAITAAGVGKVGAEQDTLSGKGPSVQHSETERQQERLPMPTFTEVELNSEEFQLISSLWGQAWQVEDPSSVLETILASGGVAEMPVSFSDSQVTGLPDGKLALQIEAAREFTKRIFLDANPETQLDSFKMLVSFRRLPAGQVLAQVNVVLVEDIYSNLNPGTVFLVNKQDSQGRQVYLENTDPKAVVGFQVADETTATQLSGNIIMPDGSVIQVEAQPGQLVLVQRVINTETGRGEVISILIPDSALMVKPPAPTDENGQPIQPTPHFAEATQVSTPESQGVELVGLSLEQVVPHDYSTWSVNRVIETSDLSAPLYPELQKTVDEVIAQTGNPYLVFSYPGAQVLVDVSGITDKLKASTDHALEWYGFGDMQRPVGYEILATTEAEIEVYKNTLLKDLQIAARENQSGTQAFDIETRQLVNVEASGDSLPPLKVEFHDTEELNQFLSERGISSDFAIGTFRVSDLFLVKTVENGVLVAHVFEHNFDKGAQFASLINAILRATVNGSPNFDNYFTNPDRYFVNNEPTVPYRYQVLSSTFGVEFNPEVSVLHPPR